MKLTLTAEQRVQQCLTADYLASDHYGLIPCAVLRDMPVKPVTLPPMPKALEVTQ